MDTSGRRRRVQKSVIESDMSQYAHDVEMYKDSPQNCIALAEFEELALERLQLLRIIEEATLKGYKQFSDDWKKSIKEDLLKHGLKKYLRLMSGFNSQTEQDIQARRADHISHYILRLAYCRSEELRRWFLSRELEWFKLRFNAQTQQGIMKFLLKNDLTYTPISNEEKEHIKVELISCTPGLSDVSCEANDFYKVHFSEVLPLVKNRRVFIRSSYAYIPTTDLVICIQSKFRANLSEALNVYTHRLTSLDDDRLSSLLCNLHNIYTGKTHIEDNDKEKVNPENLDGYSKKHYPLCMRHMHEILRSTHHLKHRCRLQYGLFIKGIGVLYEDAMEYWKKEFTKTMDHEKFEKQYAYEFKHQYGKVGSMINYSPYSCIKIIMENVGPGDHHGCPYKHWDPSITKQKMIEQGLSSEGVNSVMEMVTSGHYQIACSRYFECTQGQAPSVVVSHPNQYFSDSMNLFKDKQLKKN
ncbi:unnamed protein product [Phaedon cochleariae]|uniref:DNA primase large subunit n=1 Tax=Phaedon cochleariae TaxID=80249 RepID=A0A9P0DV04_PHACE|nr:unnamed protein product [Phaedon cochleariae]